jgi:hypothetical protein
MYLVWALVIVSILAFVYFWYATTTFAAANAVAVLHLEGTEDKILSNWYNENLTEIEFCQEDDYVIAATYLKEVHNLDVDPAVIVLGQDLESNSKMEIFDVRSKLGIPVQIAITDKKLAQSLRYLTTPDMSRIYFILKKELHKVAVPFLEQTLKQRWERIAESHHRTVNNSGSYLYLSYDGPETQEPVLIEPKLTGAYTEQGVRLNLLCSNVEFNMLFDRINQIKKILPQN